MTLHRVGEQAIVAKLNRSSERNLSRRTKLGSNALIPGMGLKTFFQPTVLYLSSSLNHQYNPKDGRSFDVSQ